MTVSSSRVDLPRTTAALRECIDETLERVGSGELEDGFLRAAWCLLCVDRGDEVGLEDEGAFVRYFLENYAWTINGRRDERISAEVERVLGQMDVASVGDYVRGHPHRDAARTALRWARGETS